MLNLDALKPSPDLFVAQTRDDWRRYYGLDQIPEEGPDPHLQPSSPSRESDLVNRAITEIIPVSVIEMDGKVVISDLPPGLKHIVLFKGADSVSEIRPGDLGVIPTASGTLRAFFRSEKEDQNDSDEVDEVIRALQMPKFRSIA
jgi:hypothetical protein